MSSRNCNNIVGSRVVKAWPEKGPPFWAMKLFGLWFLPLVVALKRRTEALPEGGVPSRSPEIPELFDFVSAESAVT